MCFLLLVRDSVGGESCPAQAYFKRRSSCPIRNYNTVGRSVGPLVPWWPCSIPQWLHLLKNSHLTSRNWGNSFFMASMASAFGFRLRFGFSPLVLSILLPSVYTPPHPHRHRTLVLSAVSSWLCRLCLCKKFVYNLQPSSHSPAKLRRTGLVRSGLLLFLVLK